MLPKELAENWIKDALKEELLGVIYIDIDDLKSHNNVFGYQMGDETIDKVSNEITKGLKNTQCKFSRIAGDEFIVILSGKEAENTFAIADKIRSSISELKIKLVDEEDEWWYSGQRKKPNYVSVSIGTYIIKSANIVYGTSWVLEMADASCLFAKFAGRNRVVKIDLR